MTGDLARIRAKIKDAERVVILTCSEGDERLRTLPLDAIQAHVVTFIEFARSRPELTFHMTAIGCGLAGYRAPQIAPMFRDSPPNVILPDVFKEALAPRQAAPGETQAR